MLYAKSKKNDPSSVNITHVCNSTAQIGCAMHFIALSQRTPAQLILVKLTLHSIRLKPAVKPTLTCPPRCVIERTTSPAYHGQVVVISGARIHCIVIHLGKGMKYDPATLVSLVLQPASPVTNKVIAQLFLFWV